MTDHRDGTGRFEGDATRGSEPRSFADGRYVVRSRLGAGNFATVYLAHDERLDVLVAIKLLADRWSWEPEVRSRFVQEARLLRSINDPLVVQIRDIAETPEGLPYLVMDYADRGTLERRLLELAQRNETPDLESVRVVAKGMAEALGALHRRRIAHRDIKPSNLLITLLAGPPVLRAGNIVLRPDERLVLGDLGLAKDLTVGSGLTIGAGTAGYMAPEQSRAGSRVDTRTDIFGTSALLAEVASGQSPDPIRRYSNGRLEVGSPLPDTIPPSLRVALARGLDADPDLRPQTIEAWLASIQEALGPEAVPTGPVPVVAPVAIDATGVPPDRREDRATSGGRSRRVALVAAAGVVLIGGVGVALAAGGDGGSPGAGPSTSAVSTSLASSSTSLATSTTAATGTTAAGTSGSSTTRPPRGAGTTTVTTVPPTVATSPPATSPPATSPPVTAAPTTAPPATVPKPTATINGPTTINVGVPASWTVESANAVRGTWSLTGPVQPGNPNWSPGDGFGGTWNVQGTFTLTLTVFNAADEQAVTSITFTVV